MLLWTVQSVVVAAVLAAVAWAAGRAFRIGPVARHALWLVVLAKMLTPPLVAWPWDVGHVAGWFDGIDRPAETTPVSPPSSQPPVVAAAPPVVLPTPTPTEAAVPSPTDPTTPPPEPDVGPMAFTDRSHIDLAPAPDFQPTDPVASPIPPQDATVEVDPGPVASAPTEPTPPAATPTPATAAPEPVVVPVAVVEPPRLATLVATAGWAWLIGSAAYAAVQAGRVISMARRVRRGTPADAALVREVRKAAVALRVRPVRVRVVAGLSSPAVWALRRPVLLWPAALPPATPKSAVRGLVWHELAHVRRRDHWVGWLELAAGIAWWWNPLFWYVRHRVREEAELACDAWAVGNAPGGRRAYAEGLLAVCEHVSRRPTPAPAVGAGTGGRRFLERRLAMIMRERVSLRLPRAGLAGVVLLAMTALPAWSEPVEHRGTEPAAAKSVDTLFLLRESAPSPPGGVPAEAQAMLQQLAQTERAAQQEVAERLAAKRREVIVALSRMQADAAAGGRRAEALAIGERIQALLQADADAGGPPVATRIRVARPPMAVTPMTAVPAPRVVPLSPAAPLPDPGSLTTYRGQNGRLFAFEIVGKTGSTIWGGPDAYTDDSPLATAAVHAGVVREGERAVVRVRILPGRDSYQGSTANGVTSSSYPSYGGSYTVERAPGLTATLAPPPQPDPGSLSGFRDRIGRSFVFDVTGSTEGSVWGGPEAYTDDSRLAAAAVHAGLVRPGERKLVVAQIIAGKQSYEGSTANGVSSYSYGPWEGSYRLRPLPARNAYAVPATPVGPGMTAVPGTTSVPGVTTVPGMMAAPQPDPGSLTAFRGQVGAALLFTVRGSTSGAVWGTDAYTDDSTLATAAVHAGVVADGEQAVVRVTILPGLPSYGGSTRNGVTSGHWPAYPGSYRVDRVVAAPTLRAYPSGRSSDTIRDTVTIRPGGLVAPGGLPGPGAAPVPPQSPSALRGQVGAVMMVPLVGSADGTIWGTDIYTDDSDLATAAVHAGVLKAGQSGTVKVTILPGRSSYSGSTRDGVTSRPYAGWGGSYMVESPDDNAFTPRSGLRLELRLDNQPEGTPGSGSASEDRKSGGAEPPK